MCLKNFPTVNMTSQVILVMIVLVLSYLISAEKAENKLKTDVTEQKKIHHMGNVQLSVIRRPSKPPVKFSTKVSRPTSVNTTIHRKPVRKLNVKPNKSPTVLGYKLPNLHTAIGEDKSDKKDHPRKQKKQMNRALMALLLAYKLKFAALVPSMFIGLLLLLGTTALAGFFFALFAAILGLKV